MVIFCFFHSFCIQKLGSFYREELSLLFHLFIQLPISVWTQRYLFYSMGHIPALSIPVLLFRWFHLWILGAPSTGSRPFNMLSFSFLSTSLVSDPTRFSRVILYFLCLSPGMGHFFKELLG